MTGAIVTGGSSGIGLALASLIAATGTPVLLLARRPDRLAASQRLLATRFPSVDVMTFAADVGDADRVQMAVDVADERFGGLSWAVASAGLAIPGRFPDQTLSDHVDQMRVNYFGSLHLARAITPVMERTGGGRLVFVSSGAALVGIHGYSAYSPSKFAVRGLAECLRVELRPKRIGVTVAYPPDTRTPQWETENALKPEATRRITAGGGLWEADAVARSIFDAALQGRFTSTQGWPLRLVAMLHSLIAPGLRARQHRIVAGSP